MKAWYLATLILMITICGADASDTFNAVAPHLSTNAAIIWRASLNFLPDKLWVCQSFPQSFSPAVISNALVIGNFDVRRFFTNGDSAIWDRDNDGDPTPDYFGVATNLSSILCRRERHPVGTGDTNSGALRTRALSFARQMGVDSFQILTNVTAKEGRVSFPRRIDGVPFFEDMQGFSVTFGNRGEVRLFSLTWPHLEPFQFYDVARQSEIEACIRNFKTVVLPRPNESDLFARVKQLSKVKAMTIMSADVFYGEGRFGERPDEQKPDSVITPFIVLHAVAQMEETNFTFNVGAPILRCDVQRLLKTGAR